MLGVIANYKEVVNTPERRQVLTSITGGQLLVQLSSLPVTLALPSMARSFGTDLETASWIVILNLLVLGSTVLLGARMGDKFGHPKIFFIGAIIITVGAVAIASSQTLFWVIVFRGVQGLGAGLIHGNGNAMLAFAFPAEERGRAYAFPISGSRMGTLIGIAIFGIFLEFLSWRLVFLTILPIGLIVMWTSLPMLRRNAEALPKVPVSIDFIGAGFSRHALGKGAFATLGDNLVGQFGREIVSIDNSFAQLERNHGHQALDNGERQSRPIGHQSLNVVIFREIFDHLVVAGLTDLGAVIGQQGTDDIFIVCIDQPIRYFRRDAFPIGDRDLLVRVATGNDRQQIVVVQYG